MEKRKRSTEINALALALTRMLTAEPRLMQKSQRDNAIDDALTEFDIRLTVVERMLDQLIDKWAAEQCKT